jgi:hypothetical protein
VFSERTSVGLDVHARPVDAAAIDGVTGDVVKARLIPDQEDSFGGYGLFQRRGAAANCRCATGSCTPAASLDWTARYAATCAAPAGTGRAAGVRLGL